MAFDNRERPVFGIGITPSIGNVDVIGHLRGIAGEGGGGERIANGRSAGAERYLVELRLTGGQNGTGDPIGVHARSVAFRRTVVVLAVRRYLADEVLAGHVGGDGKALRLPDQLGVVRDRRRVLGARHPGIRPRARVGDGVFLPALFVIDVCPQGIACGKGARFRGVAVVFVLGVLNVDLRA